MHNLIQDMGREVIREESKYGKCRHLHLCQGNALEELQNLEMDFYENCVHDCKKIMAQAAKLLVREINIFALEVSKCATMVYYALIFSMCI